MIGWGFADEISLIRTPIELLALPEARFVTKVSVRATDEAIAKLAEYAPPTLREITARGRGAVTDLSPLAPRLPVLRKLDLCTELAPDAIVMLARAPLNRLVDSRSVATTTCGRSSSATSPRSNGCTSSTRIRRARRSSSHRSRRDCASST